MTISNTQVEESWSGDNSTLVFDIPFPFLSRSDLRAIRRSATGQETPIVIVSSTGGNGAPGTVTLAEVVGTGSTLVIYRETSPTQETDYTPHDPFPAQSHERALDKAALLIQELQEQSRAGGRFLQFPRAERNVSGVLPRKVDRLGMALGFGPNGELALYSPTAGLAPYAIRSQIYDAVDGQSVFPVNGGFDVGLVHVFLNGAKLRPLADFLQDGTSVTLLAPAQLGDIVQVLAFGSFEVAGCEPLLPVGNSSQYFDGTKALRSFAGSAQPLIDASILIAVASVFADFAEESDSAKGSSLVGHEGGTLREKLIELDSEDANLLGLINALEANKASSADLADTANAAKGSALIGHAGQTLRAKLLAVDGQIATLEAGQGAGGAIAKETRALLDADLAHAEGKVGIVTNDPTPANNTTYRKVGASGSGSWVISSEGPLDAYKAYVRDYLVKQDTSKPRSGWAWVVNDDLGRVALGIDDFGDLWIGGRRYASIFDRTLANSGDSWALVDESGRDALSFDRNGQMSVFGSRYPLYRNLDRNGYSWALADEVGNIAFGVDRGGRLVVNGSVFPIQKYPSLSRSGYSWAVVDEADRVGFGVDCFGRFVVEGRLLSDLLSEATGADLANLVQKENEGLSSIVCWGDSMTEGVSPSTPYPSILASLSGRTVYNRGIGGQKSHHIASRNGGTPILLTVTGNQIPASGSVVVTAQSASPLSWRGSQAVGGSLGGVRGNLVRMYNADLSIDTLHFSRESSGSAVNIDPMTPFFIDKVDADDDYRINVIWIGRNNLNEVDRVMSDYANMIAEMQAKRKKFLVLAPPNAAGEVVGNANYGYCIQIRDLLREKYPNNFIDIRRRIVESYNPGIPQDVVDRNNDIPPSSLRIDTIHYTTAGNTIVAQQVLNEINNRGW